MHLLPLLLAFCLQEADDAGPAPDPRSFVTDHVLEVGGTKLPYRAVAETLELRDEHGETTAEFFSFAYLAQGASPASRPVTFAFNGGPGSSSIWLHMGQLGPKIVRVPDDGEGAGSPPYPLVDNPDTFLTFTDLVFVDPIGTGFSRVVGEGSTEDHWGVDQDARSVAEFIRRWVSENERWASPKYVLGESYGGIRGSLLVRELQGGFGSMALNGVVLVSPALDMALVDGQPADATFATVLPTYAATAWFHDALPGGRPDDLMAFLADARRFVDESYVEALFLGRDLPPDRFEHVVDRLHHFTGLSREYLQRADLRVSSDRFRRELLRDRGQVVGRLDTRYLGTEADDVGEIPSGDPMSAGIAGAYVSAFHQYVASALDVRMPREYAVMNPSAGRDWKRPEEAWAAFSGYLDVTPTLARGMADNPDLHVFIASGYYDLATSFFAAEYNVRRSTMDPERVVVRHYPAGHMMYVHGPSRRALAEDVRAFYSSTGPAPVEPAHADGRSEASAPAGG